MVSSRDVARLRIGLFGLGAAVVLMFASGCSGQAGVKYARTNANAPAEPLRWTFDTDAVDGVPPGVVVFSGAWRVHAAADAPSPPNVLCQTDAAQFPALALSDAVYADVSLAAHFKPVAGRTDQAAGLLARIQDSNNYYILRANALEQDVALFKYVDGERKGVKDVSASVPSGRWQALRFEVVGDHLRGFLADQLVIEATDSTFKAGQVGLWTKADSVSCFDDVEAKTP